MRGASLASTCDDGQFAGVQSAGRAPYLTGANLVISCVTAGLGFSQASPRTISENAESRSVVRGAPEEHLKTFKGINEESFASKDLSVWIISLSELNSTLSSQAGVQKLSNLVIEPNLRSRIVSPETSLQGLRVSPDRSEVERRIEVAHLTSGVETQDANRAELVKQELKEFVRKFPKFSGASVSMNDEGVGILQWKTSEIGLALIFSGQGAATIAVRDRDRQYLDGRAKFDLSGGAPTEFLVEWEKLIKHT